MNRDLQIRMAAFAWLEAQTNIHGDVLPRTLLEEGFRFEGDRVPMVGPEGIWKPKVLESMPISITTTPKGPYQDHFGPDGFLRYAYRGKDPNHRANVGLRTALTHRVPLVYFHGVMPGKYLAEWPVYLEQEDRPHLKFFVSVDDRLYFTRQVKATGTIAGLDDENGPGRRRYITAQYRVRLHQTAFRERVLSCSIVNAAGRFGFKDALISLANQGNVHKQYPIAKGLQIPTNRTPTHTSDQSTQSPRVESAT